MAGVTPIGQPTPGAPPSDGGASVDLAVSGAGSSNLAALLSEGDVVAATVIGSNGAGQDIIEILGQKVVANLPPTLAPGAEILLQVVSVDGSNIVTRTISIDPTAAQLASVTVPPERAIPPPLLPGAGQSSGAPTAPSAAPPLVGAPPAAPSQAVFVAASVQPSSLLEETPNSAALGTPPAPSGVPAPAQNVPNALTQRPAPAAQAEPEAPSGATVSRTANPASAYRPSAGTPLAIEKAPLQSVEMRIAASRAETASRPASLAPASPGAAPSRPVAAGAAAPAQPQAAAQKAVSAPATQAIINRLTIAHRDLGTAPQKSVAPPVPGASNFAKPPAPVEPAAHAPLPGGARPERSALAFGAPPATPLRPVVLQRLETTSSAPLLAPSDLIAAAKNAKSLAATPVVPAAQTPASAAASVPANPPTPARALLDLVRVPQTATTRAAAQLVSSAAVDVSQALHTLDAALAKAGQDPRVLAARTIASFVSTLDPTKPTLATQLAAYVDHIASGSEPKLATLLGAKSASDAQQVPPGAPTPAPRGEQLPLPIPGIAEAHVAERTAALDHNLKSLLLSLVASPTHEGGAASGAIQNALTQITATQLQTLQSMQTNPGAITFAIPLPWPSGGQNAQLQIWRDAPENRGALSADNFHIGFVLNTAHLGTIAVDLQSVGRGVKLGVKTEETGSAATFRSSLSQLSERLETLKYRVVGLDAQVAARGIAKVDPVSSGPIAPTSLPEDEDPNVSVDLRI